MVNNCAIAIRNGYLIEGTFDSSMKIRFVLFGKSDKESKIKKSVIIPFLDIFQASLNKSKK
jgi:hypothetical protein